MRIFSFKPMETPRALKRVPPGAHGRKTREFEKGLVFGTLGEPTVAEVPALYHESRTGRWAERGE